MHDGMRDAALVRMKPLLFLVFLALGPALADQVSTGPGPARGPIALSPAALAIACDAGRAASPLERHENGREDLVLACMR